ncbi:MAG: MarR family winged helix-turn-helix transcriptional regulator [Sciscionella sp.]
MDPESVDRLRRVIGRLARQLNTSSTGEGLTPSQASVLGVLARRGPLNLAAIADIEGLNPTMLSRVVGKLDEATLVQRVPDPSDLRTATVEITARGRRIHERVRAHRAAAVSGCLEQLPERRQATLVEALPALEELAAELKRANSTLPR